MEMWLFRCPVATNVASKVILLDTAALNQLYLSFLRTRVLYKELEIM